jgi:hypothetical protein
MIFKMSTTSLHADLCTIMNEKCMNRLITIFVHFCDHDFCKRLEVLPQSCIELNPLSGGLWEATLRDHAVFYAINYICSTSLRKHVDTLSLHWLLLKQVTFLELLQKLICRDRGDHNREGSAL